jgi:peptidoglycan hydrolase-like protein with peptidoglycan-binding domain
VTGAACNSSEAQTPPSTTRRTTTTSTSTTTTTTTAPPIVAPAGLGIGSRGPEVQELENRLNAQKYDTGKVDGYFDSATFHAVMAFQKIHGLSRTGRATDNVLTLIGTVGPPGPLLAAGGATRIEVDLPRQVLQLYKDGALNKVVDVSTGSGKRYCVDGDCALAVTPGGSYKVFFRRNGWRISRLGKLYNPLYFNGGIAIHGAPSVPGYPASHGCVRIPMYVAEWFPKMVPNGTPVYVIGGSKAAVPFNEPAPDGTTGTGGPATTTTTEAPTTTTHTIFPPPPEPTTTTTATTVP